MVQHYNPHDGVNARKTEEILGFMHPTARAILNLLIVERRDIMAANGLLPTYNDMEANRAARVVLWLGMLEEMGVDKAMRALTQARDKVLLYAAERVEYIHLLALVDAGVAVYTDY